MLVATFLMGMGAGILLAARWWLLHLAPRAGGRVGATPEPDDPDWDTAIDDYLAAAAAASA